MRRLTTVIAAMATLGMASPAFAAPEPTTGNTLHGWCSNESLKLGCLGYIMGAADGLSYANNEKRAYCLPASVTAGQVMDVVKRFMIEHPEERHRSAAEVVLIGLMMGFPCSK